MELLVDGIHGLYIGQVLAEVYRNVLDNVNPEDIEILRKGPDEVWYWEALDNVLDSATLDGLHLCLYDGNIYLGTYDEFTEDEEDKEDKDYSGE